MLICEKIFRQLFHNISKVTNTTTLRQELKIVVSKPVADAFFADVQTLLSDSGFGIEPRDKIEQKGLSAVTSTDYLPAILGVDPQGKPIFKAQIRIRDYRLVPTGTKIDDIADISIYPKVKLADGPGDFVRLEFKVGHPMVTETGKIKEMKYVVDKPALVLDRADVMLLFKDRATFEKDRKSVV